MRRKSLKIARKTLKKRSRKRRVIIQRLISRAVKSEQSILKRLSEKGNDEEKSKNRATKA